MRLIGSLLGRWRVLVIGVLAGAGAVVVLPAFSAGADLNSTVNQTLGTVNQTVSSVSTQLSGTLNRAGLGGGGGASPQVEPRANVPPAYQPPLHGSDPHGQGTVATVGISPSADRPYSSNPAGLNSQEAVVVGRSRGSQLPDGSYHGHLTIAALFGTEILGADTAPGQTNNGPFAGLNSVTCPNPTAPLQPCLGLILGSSSTTGTGSTNHFETARVNLPTFATIDAGSSNGNISSSGSCQSAHGDSQVANANALSSAIGATAANSSSDSGACAGSAPTQTNSSFAILSGAGALGAVQIPAGGCGAGTANTQVIPLAPLLSAMCNADDTNGSTGPPAQSILPYGVREALSVFVLDVGGSSLLRTTTAASESHAVAQAVAPCPSGTMGTPPNCVPNNAGACPVGTTGTAPNCVAIQCPSGQRLSGSTCVAISCPSGQRLSGSTCVAISCPAGTRRSDGSCVPTRTCPPDCANNRGAPIFATRNLASNRRLAFTGSDLLTVALGGLLLLAAGMVIRRRVSGHR